MCSFCIGCIGLENKQYCILNTEYTKEEWEKLALKIFASMKQDGTLWEVLPASINPFYFNDTLAYLIDGSFTKEEVEAEWYLWRDEPIRVDIPEWLEVVKSSELDKFQGFRPVSVIAKNEAIQTLETLDRHASFHSARDDETTETKSSALSGTSFTKEVSWYIDPDIMKKVIVDEKWNYYRIVQMEYDFLMKYALPLPTMHWLDRIKMGFRG